MGSRPEVNDDKPAPAETLEDWKTWPEFTVFVNNLPETTTTKNLWDWFSCEGDIAYIDIFAPRNGCVAAKLRFEPPPKRDFWSKSDHRVSHSDSRRFPNGVVVKPTNQTCKGWISSPVCRTRQHPARSLLCLKEFHFGSLLSPNSMKSMRSVTRAPEQSDSSIRVEVNLSRKLFNVFFPFEVRISSGRSTRSRVREFKLVLEFSQMRKAFQTTSDEDTTLIITSKYPPRYYWKNDDVRETLQDAKNWSANEAWNRATEIVEDIEKPLRYPVALHNENLVGPSYIDIGRWTTFQFVFQDGFASRQLISALEDFNMLATVCHDFETASGEFTEMWRLLEPPSNNDALSLLQMPSTYLSPLSFEVRYQLEVCISRGIINEHTVSIAFLHQLAQTNPRKAQLLLEYLADQKESIGDPMQLFEDPDANSYFPHSKPPHYCASVRKAAITPTTIRFSTPTVEVSNRVMRRYSAVQDRFLRIQFVEESEQGRITLNKDQSEDVWRRVVRTLYQGIRIGDRVYEFLAFGSSQLRQCGAYFFCPTEHISCDDIRNWMGEFSHIKVIAKYSARLGQCFSTTREIRGISVPTIQPIRDIERNGHCFTDGIGIISQFVSQMVNEDMTLDVFDQPSAYQFRMGGCKGVLAVWPDIAKGTEVHIRESQEKFKSEFNGLEIVRCAKYATATLNRQTITILESLGVHKKAFENLLDQQIQAYKDAMCFNDVAIKLLTKFVDENQTTLVIADIIKAGFNGDKPDPFVVNVLNLWRSWSLKLLKEKARIQVEDSAFVLGCVDETGTLRGHDKSTEGQSGNRKVDQLPQIFLQISDAKEYRRTNIIKGICIVGRNPSLHPGDIRIVEAVDCPALHHLKDVVVFASTGDRPVPNMLSGGDLDGDDFFVIWDRTLIPPHWNYPPMNYTSSRPKELSRDVQVNDLRNFFVKYMKNDTLPLIATAHLAFADRTSPMSKLCLELAELHSKAVDYPKTGEPATLRRDQQPIVWPHFMEKSRSYHSNKALGVIYDKVVNKCVQFNPVWNTPFDERILKQYKPTNELIQKANGIKAQYDTSVRRLLSQHNIETEFELWTGFAMSKPAIGSDYKRQEDLGKEYDALKHRFRDMCYLAAGGKGSEHIDPFVVAMYCVTAEEIRMALDEREGEGGEGRDPVNDAGRMQPPHSDVMPLISFPWIFPWVLVRIALGKRYDPKHLRLADANCRRTNPRVLAKNSAQTGDEMQTQFPNGTIVRQGETLTLFNESQGLLLDGSGDQSEHGKGPKPDVRAADQSHRSKLDTDTDTGACSTSDEDALCAVDMLEESAINRLTSLMGDLESE